MKNNFVKLFNSNNKIKMVNSLNKTICRLFSFKTNFSNFGNNSTTNHKTDYKLHNFYLANSSKKHFAAEQLQLDDFLKSIETSPNDTNLENFLKTNIKSIYDGKLTESDEAVKLFQDLVKWNNKLEFTMLGDKNGLYFNLVGIVFAKRLISDQNFRVLFQNFIEAGFYMRIQNEAYYQLLNQILLIYLPRCGIIINSIKLTSIT